MEIITVRDMLAEMEKGKPFTICGITYDRKRNQGGTPYELEAQLIQATPGEKIQVTRQRPPTAQEAGKTPHKKSAPNHLQWFTRNVAVCQNGVRTAIIRKIQVPLIVYFNSKIVVP